MIAIREESVVVKLKRSWMGYPPSTVMRLPKMQANSMFQRDTAEILEKEQPDEIRKKLQRRDQVHDKMVKSGLNKKLN